MNEFIAQACINLRPEAGVSVDENGIHWHGINDADVPSQEEIENEAKRLQFEFEATKYQRLRKENYPAFADQFDTIFHKGLDAWKAEIQAVKDKYPKGTA